MPDSDNAPIIPRIPAPRKPATGSGVPPQRYFDLDPLNARVIVTARPADDEHTPIDFDPEAVRLVTADQIARGDLVLAMFPKRPWNASRTTADHHLDPFYSEPRPADPTCPCSGCFGARHATRDQSPPPRLITLTPPRPEAWQMCETVPSRALPLIVPASLLSQPGPPPGRTQQRAARGQTAALRGDWARRESLSSFRDLRSLMCYGAF